MDGAVRPEVLFPAYLAGSNLVESFYLSLPHLSWQTVVIGDPLCSPFARHVLSRAEIEEPVDPRTGMPRLFAERRLDVLRLLMKGTPDEALSLALLAESSSHRRDIPAALRALEEATKLAPDVAPLHLQLAIVYDSTGDKVRAAERYRQVVALEPKNVVALNNLAYWLSADPDALTEARELARRAVSLQPKNPSVLDTLGWIEHRLGNSEEAARLLTDAVNIGTRNAEIHLRAAIVYAAIGDRVRAEERLKEALRLNAKLAARDDVRDLRTQLSGKQD